MSIEQLYRQFSKDVYRFALYLSADPAMAEDITAETFVRAWTTPTVVRTQTVKAYLLAIARNLYLKEVQRRGRHRELSEALHDANDLSRQTEAREMLQRTLQLLQTIAEGDRAALLMHAVDQMPYEDIAGALGIKLQAVKTRIFRARLRLAELEENAEWKTLKSPAK